MKRFCIFVAAFALGSLAVVGQEEEDPNRALKEQIDQLIARFETRLEEHRGDAERSVAMASFEISDLCSPVRDQGLVPGGLFRSNAETVETPDYEPRVTYETDLIIELVRQLVSPASWDNIEGADIQPRNTGMLVRNVPVVLRQIPLLLDELRAFLDAQVAVDIVAVAPTEAVAALVRERPRELTPEEAQQLLATAKHLGGVHLVAFDGQQVVQRNGETCRYVADYDVTVAEGAAMGCPVQAEAFQGCTAPVRACLARGGQGAVLHCFLELTRLGEPVRRVETVHGPLELPELGVTRLMSSLWVPLGRTVVLGGGATADGEGCLFLATARLVRPDAR